jgi:hypothetical protein
VSIYHGGVVKGIFNYFPMIYHNITIMEEDRAEVDLGVAVDIEERLEEEEAQRQPKKRFVGRRQAAEAALKNGSTASVEDSGAIQGKTIPTKNSRRPY